MNDIERLIQEYTDRINYFSDPAHVARYTKDMEGGELREFKRSRMDDAIILAALRTQQDRRWISVKDRLPEPGNIVLVRQTYSWEHFEDGAEVTIGRLRPVEPPEKPYWEFQYYRPDFRNGTIMDNDIICPGSKYVTHWMPLPEQPKETQK